MQKHICIHKWIATGFGSGYSPVAPGTAGALLAWMLWLVLFFAAGYSACWWITLALAVVFTWLGVRSANALEPIWGEDPSRVVVDEMVGTWIALLAVPEGSFAEVWGYAAGAFVLFRFFDIFKPLGVRRMEALPGGVGVMADDILAGVYGFVVLVLVQWL